jgi:hypothetical protein
LNHLCFFCNLCASMMQESASMINFVFFFHLSGRVGPRQVYPRGTVM